MKEELAGKCCAGSINENINFQSAYVNDLWFEEMFIFRFSVLFSQTLTSFFSNST